MEFAEGAKLWSDLVRLTVNTLGPAGDKTYGIGGALIIEADLGAVNLGELLVCNFYWVGHKLVALGYIDCTIMKRSGTAAIRFSGYTQMPTNRQWNTPVGSDTIVSGTAILEVTQAGTLALGLYGSSDANQGQTGQNTCSFGVQVIRSV